MKQKNPSTVIWDLPTRAFHWLLVLSFLLAWLSYDDNRFLFVHVYAGYTMLALLGFRFLWGVIGTRYARFHSFAYDWRSVTAYLKGLLDGTAMRHIGHNPIGGWAIFLLLALGLAVAFSGLITLGGEEGHGPLAGWVGFRIGILSREWHTLLAWGMLGLTAIHVTGVLAESLFHRDNLIWSMITGRKDGTAGEPGVHGHHLLGLLMVVLVSASALFYFRGYLTESADNLYQPYTGPELPDNAQWREACGECHFAFHPSLLPRRSWEKMFSQQHEHFGEDLDLSEDDAKSLLEFHLKYPAESNLTEPSRKILYYTPENELPLRVSETHYIVKKHKDIEDVYWKHNKVKSKSNCSACHLDANRGTYEDSDMRLPDINTK
ncbi:MAG: cytochrome b/b6 domain-containing protein [Gammaproteobacteria bacterium]|nr:cytochrome b/b6 domain-containing protein [Gammaproteobacteria bacterium]MDH5800585.1 cytochrome b/b6 domain-containing protein [Gammaproteobacteria bacterium]